MHWNLYNSIKCFEKIAFHGCFHGPPFSEDQISQPNHELCALYHLESKITFLDEHGGEKRVLYSKCVRSSRHGLNWTHTYFYFIIYVPYTANSSSSIGFLIWQSIILLHLSPLFSPHKESIMLSHHISMSSVLKDSGCCKKNVLSRVALFLKLSVCFHSF